MTARLSFTDPISGQECQLVISNVAVGIAHPGCEQLADLSIQLDAFYCPACRWNGRVSGAWCADMIAQDDASG